MVGCRIVGGSFETGNSHSFAYIGLSPPRSADSTEGSDFAQLSRIVSDEILSRCSIESKARP